LEKFDSTLRVAPTGGRWIANASVGHEVVLGDPLGPGSRGSESGACDPLRWQKKAPESCLPRA